MKKTISGILSAILAIVLTGLMCITASAAVLSGDGTMNNPYTISTAAELNAFSKAVADGNSFSGMFIVLKNDITANSSFAPIGTKTTPFKGTFDGNGKKLSGFDVITDYAGLFAFTDGAVISDVTVSGSFEAINYAGAIVAYAEETVIENCKVSALVYADESYAGGVAGSIDSGKIASCTTESAASIGSFTEYCGGIAGYSTAEITNCTNNAYTYGGKNVGGIAGYSAGDIISCTNTVAVSSSKTNLGGIAGLAEAAVKYCKNTGRISNSDSKAGKTGGIAGVADNAEIIECMNNGAVAATGSFAGGIAGYATKTDITNCIATADVSSTAEYAGGIFGFALGGTTADCVFTATVTAKNNTKGGIGAIAQGTVSDCYFISSAAGKAVLSGTATNTKAVSEADLTDSKKLSALDFTNVWTINTVHASYPLLENITYHSLKISVSTEASCTENGEFKGTCTLCNETVQKITPAYGHSNMTVSSQAASCTKAGFKDVLCTVCSETDTVTIPATGHTDADTNNLCDVCGADTTEKQPDSEKSFFEKIADFFNSIFARIKAFFENLF